MDAGWVYYKGSDHCYRYFDHQDYDTYYDEFHGFADPGDSGITHSEAESSCANEGGHLFSPNNVEEMRFVQTNILMYVYFINYLSLSHILHDSVHTVSIYEARRNENTRNSNLG